MLECPWPGGTLLNCRFHFNWLSEHGLVDGANYAEAVWTPLGAQFCALPQVAIILQSSRLPYTKRFVPDRTGALKQVPQKHHPYLHDTHLGWFGSVEDIHACLSVLEGVERMCVIRGGPMPGVKLAEVRRSGDEFTDVERGWLCFDLDDLAYAVPEHEMLKIDALCRAFDTPEVWSEAAKHTPEKDALLAAQELLEAIAPPEFWRVNSLVQLSSSTGIKPESVGLRCGIHWWLCLDRPMSSAEANAWATSMLARSMESKTSWNCDTKLFQPVQVHYTAGPILPPDTLGIRRLGQVCLPDRLAQMLGAEQPVARGTLCVPCFDLGDNWHEMSGGSGEEFGGMSEERRAFLICQITSGQKYYPAYMPIVKSAYCHGMSCDEIEETIRALIDASPDTPRKIERLRGLRADVIRLCAQVDQQAARGKVTKRKRERHRERQ